MDNDNITANCFVSDIGKARKGPTPLATEVTRVLLKTNPTRSSREFDSRET